MEIVLSDASEVIEPAVHDARLLGVLLTHDGVVQLPLEQASGDRVTLELKSPVRLRVNEFQLAIIDLTMPGLGGIEVARQLLAIQPDLPIILTTGFNVAATEDQIREVGVAKLLMKPFTTDELGRVVADVLRK